MSDKIDKLAKGIRDAITESADRKPSPYDTQATVLSKEGDILWVHIPGGVDRTPVRRTVDADKGDKVMVRISDGRAWTIGNMTNPPTDGRLAEKAYRQSMSVSDRFGNLSEFVTDNARIVNADIENVKIKNVEMENVMAQNARITNSFIDGLTAEGSEIRNSKIEGFTVIDGVVQGLQADRADIYGRLTASEAVIESLDANYAHITDGVIDNAKIGYADVDDLDAHYAEIDLANVNNAWIEYGAMKKAEVFDENVFDLSGDHATIRRIDASKINVANLRADNLVVRRINGQPVVGGYTLIDSNSSGYASKNPQALGWYEFVNAQWVLSTDTTVNMTKAYYQTGNEVSLYDQAYIDGLEDDLQQQIDGAVETFTGSVVPTLVNWPYTDWYDTSVTPIHDERAKHVGDIYYVVNSASDENGYCYRFAYDNTSHAYSWVLIKDSDVTKALSDISELQTFESTTTSWIDETDEGLETIRTNHTTLAGVVDKTVKESVQLWFTKANTTAPNKPTAEVTSTSTAGNAWRKVVPAYNASYPNYYYCWQYKFVDGTFGWSDVVRDIAMGETQGTSRDAKNTADAALPAQTFEVFESTTFTDLVDEVDEQSTTMTNMTTRLGLNSDGTGASTDIVAKESALEQTADVISTRVGKTETKLIGMYATSSTAEGTRDKVATITPALPSDAPWELGTGTMVTVKFTKANTYAATSSNPLRLNVNGKGLKPIKTYANGDLSEAEYKWAAGSTFTFVYNGTNWLMQDSSVSVRMNSNETSISQTADSIISLASGNTTYTKPDGTTVTSAIGTTVNQTANNVLIKATRTGATTAEQQAGGTSAAALINVAPDTVKIAANHVEIDGTATFNAIKTSADAAYDSKGSASAVQTNLDNLEIGGRNLFRNSNKLGNTSSNTYGWQANGSAYTVKTEFVDGEECLHCTGSCTGAYIPSIVAAQRILLEWGNVEYVVSCDLKFDKETKAGSAVPVHYHNGYTSTTNPFDMTNSNAGGVIDILTVTPPVNTIIPANTWTHFEQRIRTKASGSGLYPTYRSFIFGAVRTVSETATVNMYLKNYKFERGNKATNWTPAPEDVQAEIDMKYTSINVTSSTADKDLNNYKTTGIYHCSTTMTNAPLTNHGTVIVDWNVGTKFQEYHPDNVTYYYKRTWNNTTSAWNAWSDKIDALAAQATANAAAPKSSAIAQEQRIYYRSNSTTAPTAPTTWVTSTATANSTWSTKRMQYDRTYKYLYTCIQKQTVSGTITNTTVLLDDTTTVIDGGNIITGTVAANQIASNAITADKIAAGAITIGKMDSNAQNGVVYAVSTSQPTSGADTNYPYLKLCTIQPKQAYVNREITFDISSRGSRMDTSVNWAFNNSGSATTAVVSHAYKTGGAPLYYASEGDGKYGIYLTKAERYDGIKIHNLFNPFPPNSDNTNGIVITWDGTEVTALPSGYVAFTALAGSRTSASIDNAAKTASNYIYADSSGIRIASANPSTQNQRMSLTSSALEMYDSGNTRRVRINASEGVTIGPSAQNHLVINDSATEFYSNTTQYATIANNSGGLNIHSAQSVWVTGDGGVQINSGTGNILLETNSYNTWIQLASTITANGNVSTTGSFIANNGFLYSNANGNTLTIGSQNAGFCHIYNSANVGFAFNNYVCTVNGGSLGTATYPWGYVITNQTLIKVGAPTAHTTSYSAVWYLHTDGLYYLSRPTSSSRRYKRDIVKVKDSKLDPHRLYDVPVVQFRYTDGYLSADDPYNKTRHNVIGFIAEDIEKYYPIASIKVGDEADNWNERYVIPPMLALIQEQHEDIEKLKAELNNLKGAN